MTRLYGIKNCDTVKKARTWLDAQKIAYEFYDFRADRLTEDQVKNWLDALGIETLVNKRSTTWKALDEKTKSSFTEETAPAVVAANPTLIKRPLLETTTTTHVGFNATDYQQIFSHQK
jgi:arsenate reductase